MPGAKDLFDESSMSFGSHLESLRTHLIRAILGLFVGVAISLIYGDTIIKEISAPILEALEKNSAKKASNPEKTDFWKSRWDTFQQYISGKEKPNQPKEKEDIKKLNSNTIRIKVSPRMIAQTLHEAYPEIYNAPPKKKDAEEDEYIYWTVSSDDIQRWNQAVKENYKPKTFNVQEAFLTYLKVALVSGFILASPWIFYQLWLFVAAGLYPHERKYVYLYMPVSIGLFLLGAFFCFKWVLPLVLVFLLEFNNFLNTQATIRLSEYISFAIMLPVMFGLSFQLPLVMLLLERLHIMNVKTYREKRRMAILIISIASMLMTPSDPMSMMMMMIPLCILYELGIWMCKMAGPQTNPFDEIAAT
ncbi:Twin-arginine translocation protein TatC [hydrothermal vent metagenome]|uniref:Twin-arginine translocation protein TatC n=1 Tax=hydrothermal vent metagenome TaxID=652676 RepID=A0A3B1DX00_9ZZZZ